MFGDQTVTKAKSAGTRSSKKRNSVSVGSKDNSGSGYESGGESVCSENAMEDWDENGDGNQVEATPSDGPIITKRYVFSNTVIPTVVNAADESDVQETPLDVMVSIEPEHSDGESKKNSIKVKDDYNVASDSHSTREVERTTSR